MQNGRSLLGCGFLLGLPLLAAAQRGPELSVSVGGALARPAITRTNIPAGFGVAGYPSPAAALWLVLPLSARLGIGLEQRLTGLGLAFRYHYPDGSGSSSSGLRPDAVHQSGVALRLYDVVRPGANWHLDAALTASYAWASPHTRDSEFQLLGTAGAGPPRAGSPQLHVRQQSRRAGTPMVGAEVLLAYELSGRQQVLLIASYQRGLHPVAVLRSVRADYIDAAGTPQQGSLTLSTRGSYATLQLGYGLCLRRGAGAARRNATPRYSIDATDAEEEASGPGSE